MKYAMRDTRNGKLYTISRETRTIAGYQPVTTLSLYPCIMLSNGVIVPKYDARPDEILNPILMDESTIPAVYKRMTRAGSDFVAVE
jgi:hypothetical protein